MPLKEFNADQRREQRARFGVTIGGQKFQRVPMTGARFLEILENPPDVEDDFDGVADEDLTDAQLTQRMRSRAARSVKSTYRQIAELIEPADPTACDIDSSLRDDDPEAYQEAVQDWLAEKLDWADAPALLEQLTETGQKGKGAAG